jgi:hypothetical protein
VRVILAGLVFIVLVTGESKVKYVHMCIRIFLAFPISAQGLAYAAAYEQNLIMKICEYFFENLFLSILVEFAIIQAFTAP